MRQSGARIEYRCVSVEDMKEQAVEKVRRLARKHLDREPTEAETEFARRYISQQHEDPFIRTPKLPTYTKMREEFDWELPQKALRNYGVTGTMYGPNRPR